MPVDGEIGVDGDAEQPPLAGGVDGDVEHGAGLQHAPDNPTHLSVLFLKHQDLAVPDEGHRRRQRQSAGDDLDLEPGVVDRLRRDGERHEKQERDDR